MCEATGAGMVQHRPAVGANGQRGGRGRHREQFQEEALVAQKGSQGERVVWPSGRYEVRPRCEQQPHHASVPPANCCQERRIGVGWMLGRLIGGAIGEQRAQHVLKAMLDHMQYVVEVWLWPLCGAEQCVDDVDLVGMHRRRQRSCASFTLEAGAVAAQCVQGRQVAVAGGDLKGRPTIREGLRQAIHVAQDQVDTAGGAPIDGGAQEVLAPTTDHRLHGAAPRDQGIEAGDMAVPGRQTGKFVQPCGGETLGGRVSRSVEFLEQKTEQPVPGRSLGARRLCRPSGLRPIV